MAAQRNSPQRASEGISAGHSHSDDAVLRRLAGLIADSPHNLVAAGERATVYERHVREALAVGAALSPAPGSRWLDLGTGGGLPGLVLAVRYPTVAWVLLDATRKKIAAVEAFAATLGLDNVAALHGRAETVAHEPAERGSFDGVIARAVAPLVTLAELARGFLRADGVLAAVKGPAWREELAQARQALSLLRFADVHSSDVATVERPTWLVTMRAVGDPPAGYPRRDGMPRRHPLGRPPR